MPNRLLIILTAFVLLMTSFSIDAAENSTELYERGASLAKKGNMNEAVRIFKEVIRISPSYSLGHYGLGKSYLFFDDRQADAVRHLKICVTLDRSLAKGYFYLGMAYYFSDDYVRSIHSLKTAYTKDQSLVAALYNLSIMYDIINRKYQSLVYYRKYIEELEKDEDDVF